MTQFERVLLVLKKAIQVNNSTNYSVDANFFGTGNWVELYIFPSKDANNYVFNEKIYLDEPDEEIDDLIEEALDVILETGELPINQ